MKPPRSRPMKLELDGKQRLNKILAAAGYGSRRSVDELIEQGRVEINDEPCTRLGTQIDPATDKVTVDGEAIKIAKPIYYAVNKPAGIVCTNRDPQGRSRVIDLIPQGARLFSIGRLDRNSTGLILMTNDGTVAQRLTHPKYGVSKSYRVLVAGAIEREDLNTLKKGVYLAEGKAKADDAKIKKSHKNSTEIEIILSEGKNREIRRVLARFGHKVLALQRISVGPIKLANLAEGDYRPLTSQEIDALKRTAVRLGEGKKKKGKSDESKARRDVADDLAQETAARTRKPTAADLGIEAQDIPAHLADDPRFISDPSQIPAAIWDDEEDEGIVDTSAKEEFEADLKDFFESDAESESEDEVESESNAAMAELESAFEDEGDEDEDEDDDFNPFMAGGNESGDDFDGEELEGLSEDAVLIRETDSSRSGRVISDEEGRAPRGPRSEGSHGRDRGSRPRSGEGRPPRSRDGQGNRGGARSESRGPSRDRSSGPYGRSGGSGERRFGKPGDRRDSRSGSGSSERYGDRRPPREVSEGGGSPYRSGGPSQGRSERPSSYSNRREGGAPYRGGRSDGDGRSEGGERSGGYGRGSSERPNYRGGRSEGRSGDRPRFSREGSDGSAYRGDRSDSRSGDRPARFSRGRSDGSSHGGNRSEQGSGERPRFSREGSDGSAYRGSRPEQDSGDRPRFSRGKPGGSYRGNRSEEGSGDRPRFSRERSEGAGERPRFSRERSEGAPYRGGRSEGSGERPQRSSGDRSGGSPYRSGRGGERGSDGPRSDSRERPSGGSIGRGDRRSGPGGSSQGRPYGQGGSGGGRSGGRAPRSGSSGGRSGSPYSKGPQSRGPRGRGGFGGKRDSGE